MSEEIKDAGDFIRGQRDCKEGKPHKSGQGSDYDRGYSSQYEFEEVLSAGKFN